MSSYVLGVTLASEVLPPSTLENRPSRFGTYVMQTGRAFTGAFPVTLRHHTHANVMRNVTVGGLPLLMTKGASGCGVLGVVLMWCFETPPAMIPSNA